MRIAIIYNYINILQKKGAQLFCTLSQIYYERRWRYPSNRGTGWTNEINYTNEDLPRALGKKTRARAVKMGPRNTEMYTQ